MLKGARLPQKIRTLKIPKKNDEKEKIPFTTPANTLRFNGL